MRKVMGAAVAVLGIFVGTQTASADDLSIKAFSGLWEGNAVSYSNNSAEFPITSRDLDVEIKPASDSRFEITWRTLLRQKGSPDKPKSELKETKRIYEKEAGDKVWRQQPAGSGFDGQPLSWVTLKDQTLTLYSMAVRDDGGYDMLIYARTLTGLNMKLDFKALRNGEVRRTAGGTLIKTAN
ncbi:MAG: hypothetical protein JJ879_05375 [Sneathiella sp.]|nr:hypothetical protein [Sneathiella sp.]